MIAIIQAGGKGTRLRPYTLTLPKPLMPLGDSPVIEILLKWLRRWGVTKTYITIGYLGQLIRALCSDGRQWDMDIEYSHEKEPLGTIGPLCLIRRQLNETFITINGDVICDMNLRDFVNFHKSHDGVITVAVTEKNVKVDLGVLESQNGQMIGFQEKPELKYIVSMGIYCMDPKIMDLVPNNVPFGFDNLMHEMMERDLPVYMYRHDGLWLDIGREEDYRHANECFLKDYKNLILGC